MPWILENEGGLQIAGTVKAAGQPEVALQPGAGLLEEIENALWLRRHKRLLYHWKISPTPIKSANQIPLAHVFFCLEQLENDHLSKL